jgi:hypothetical protein
MRRNWASAQMTAQLKHSNDLAQRIRQIVNAKYPARVTRVFFRTGNVQLVITQDGSGANFPLGSIDKLQQMGDDELNEHIWKMRAIPSVF